MSFTLMNKPNWIAFIEQGQVNQQKVGNGVHRIIIHLVITRKINEK